MKIPEIIDDMYIHGRCHIFALALHNVFGYKMIFLWDTESWDEDGNIGTSLTHAYTESNTGKFFDARGILTRANIEDDFSDFLNDEEEVVTTVQDLQKLIAEKILIAPKRGELEKLQQYIIQHKEVYNG